MKDKYIFLILLAAVAYITLFIYLADNISFWLEDEKRCFEVMEFWSFIKNHTHIFLFQLLFVLMGFQLLKSLYTGLIEIKRLKELSKVVELLKVKTYKNLVVIDTNEKIAFNLLDKIIVSKPVLSMSKSEKRSIFFHEKGHLLSRDSFKIIFAKIGLLLFPNFIREKLLKRYVLFLEANADRYASRYVKKTDLAKTILQLKSTNSYYPMANNFTEERLKVLLEGKTLPVPWSVYVLIGFLLAFFILVLLYKTCFCGVM